MASHTKSFAYRLGNRIMSRRNPLHPKELSDFDLMVIYSGSHRAAETLKHHFSNIKELAQFGGEKGFAVLAGYPHITPNIIAKLEAWLEGIGRVME